MGAERDTFDPAICLLSPWMAMAEIKTEGTGMKRPMRSFRLEFGDDKPCFGVTVGARSYRHAADFGHSLVDPDKPGFSQLHDIRLTFDRATYLIFELPATGGQD